MKRELNGNIGDGKKINDLHLNLRMMEAIGGTEIHGDRPKHFKKKKGKDYIDVALDLVDDPNRLGPAN